MANGGAFTHNFWVEIGPLKLKGEVEFNTDGQVSYKATPDEQMSLEARDAIRQIFEAMRDLHVHLGDPFIKFKVEGK